MNRLEPHRIELPIPGLPSALHNFTIAHVSDLHLLGAARLDDRLIRLLAARRVDLVAITGDLQVRRRSPQPALDWIRRLTESLRPTCGFVACLGNHDGPEIRQLADQRLDPPPEAGDKARRAVIWLGNRAIAWPGLPLDLVGIDAGYGQHRLEDPVASARALGQLLARGAGDAQTGPSGLSGQAGTGREPPRRVRIMLSHLPAAIMLGARMGVDLVLAGHTHGGQIRWPHGMPIIAGSPFGRRCASGLMRVGDTLGAVSRGVGGKVWIPRLFCPPHLPIYHLVPGHLPGSATAWPVSIRHW